MFFSLTRYPAKQTVLASAAAVFGLLAGGCNSAGVPRSGDLKVISQVALPEALEETSGLACTSDGFVTLNDSGNDPVLFHLLSSGDITHQQKIGSANNDWEALAVGDKYFYIGDVGNNRGNRTNLAIIKVDRASGSVVSRLPVSYANNEPDHNMPYMHNHDAEALVEKDGYLYLFSKSWDSGVAAVYQLSKGAENLALKPVVKLKNLPGLVTGAAYDSSGQRFLVTGYLNNPLGMFKPFVATLAENWETQNILPLTGFGQVESICVTEKGDVWITQESSLYDPAKLVNIQLP